MLREEFLIPLGIAPGSFFGTTSGFWMGLQADYDTEEAAKELSGVLAQIYRYEPIAA